MKKIKIAALILLISIMLTSCDTGAFYPSDSNTDSNITSPPAGDTESSGEEESTEPEIYNNEKITFDKGEEVAVVVNSSNTDCAVTASEIIYGVTGKSPIVMTDKYSQKKPNELVIGNCNRQVSREAYDFLEEYERENKYIARIVFYSLGNSVCIAYDSVDGYDGYIINYAFELFKTKYVKQDMPINIPNGYAYLETIDFIARQKELDKELEAKAWADFEKAAGAEATAALKTMYETIYSGDIVSWLAGIYDTKTGGFYFANSTRDNEQTTLDGINYYDLLPDIESTDQALEFIRMSGMLGGSTLKDSLPEWMKTKIIKFVKERQDENGYFYHPQWTKEMVDSELSRRGRDLSKAISTLAELGAKPTYDTTTGVKGDGIRADGTAVSKTALTLPIKTSVLSAVSYVLATNGSYPSHLENKEAFESYLESLNEKMATDSYWVGNQLAAQADQIKARDAELKAEGADYSLSLILKDWLDSKCYESTGHWSQTPDYPGLNGFLKISATYQALGLALPYPEAAARSAVDSIELSGRYPTACFAYNSWMAVCNIINNVNKHKSKEEAGRIVGNIRAELHERAPELIKITMEKQGAFLLEDGSFMYIESGSSGTSQNLPISIPGTIEGTMNSTLLCTTGTISHMMAAFGYPTVPILYRSDLNEFITLVEAKR